MREPGFVVLDMEYTYERNALSGFFIKKQPPFNALKKST